MGKQLALGAVPGSIVLFVWSAIAWMLIPWPGEPLRGFTNDDAVVQAITSNATRSGNYIVPMEPKRAPGMTEEQYQKAVQTATDRMSRGPMIFASVRLEPFGSMAKPLVMQYFTQLLVALIATFLLLQTAGLAYGARVLFVTAIGLIIFVGGHVDEWIWWSFSNAYMLMQFGAIVIGWFLAALVIAKFVRGKANIAAA